jgi:hypothetical protein
MMEDEDEKDKWKTFRRIEAIYNNRRRKTKDESRN